MVDIPGGQIGERAAAAVLELDQRRPARCDRDGRVTAAERLSCDFSSAQTTSSSGRSRRPSKRRWYRSSTRPAFSAKRGSRGKIQQRCCHGFKASSCSQRQIVEAEAPLTPRSITSRCSSVREKRESGSPWLTGSPHASALTSATCSGGKTARAARALSILESGQPLLEEPLPPTTNDLRHRLQPPRDLRVALTVGRVQDHLRPHHHLVRQRVTGDATLQLGTLLAAQHDYEPARPRHADTIRCREHGPFTDY